MFETNLIQFPAGFSAPERVNLSELERNRVGRTPPLPPTRILDARPVQAEARGEAAFFDAHGFVLLDSPTRVTDWNDGGQIASLYHPEIEAAVRNRLFPGRRLELMQPPLVVRRGAGTDNPRYGTGVHQDHGTSADDFQHNVAAFTSAPIAAGWRAAYEGGEVEGFVALDFWRTTGMKAPLRHMPLALCDAASIEARDIVETALEGIAPGGITRHLCLAHNPGQRWYHYPVMTGDELLVFKLFELRKSESPQLYRACFHTAVEDPTTPPAAEPRQSCEHRVTVMLLKD